MYGCRHILVMSRSSRVCPICRRRSTSCFCRTFMAYTFSNDKSTVMDGDGVSSLSSPVASPLPVAVVLSSGRESGREPVLKAVLRVATESEKLLETPSGISSSPVSASSRPASPGEAKNNVALSPLPASLSTGRHRGRTRKTFPNEPWPMTRRSCKLRSRDVGLRVRSMTERHRFSPRLMPRNPKIETSVPFLRSPRVSQLYRSEIMRLNAFRRARSRLESKLKNMALEGKLKTFIWSGVRLSFIWSKSSLNSEKRLKMMCRNPVSRYT